MRLLVIEDEPRLQRALAKALRENGYAVDTAGDGLFKASTCDYPAELRIDPERQWGAARAGRGMSR